MTHPLKDRRTYAVYHQDDFICMGTPEEICKSLDTGRVTFLKRVAAYRKWQTFGGKLPFNVVFCLDDEDETEGEWENENE